MFRTPGFTGRQDAAKRAKDSALSLYRARPQLDPATLAKLLVKRLTRETADATKRNAMLRATAEADEIAPEPKRHVAAAAEAKAFSKAPVEAKARTDSTILRVSEGKVWTEDDRKAAGDTRYAARKTRKLRSGKIT